MTVKFRKYAILKHERESFNIEVGDSIREIATRARPKKVAVRLRS